MQYATRSLAVLATLAFLVGCASQQSANPEASLDPSSTPATLHSASLEVQMINAIDNGDPGAVQAVLDQGLSPDAPIGGTTDDPQLPLHLAAKNDQTAIITVLIDAGATVDATSGGLTPLMLAASSAGTDTIEALLQSGADVSLPNFMFYSATAWHYAGRDGNIEALQVFLDTGVDIDLADNTKTTALIYAAIDGRTEAVQFLLDQGADPNLRDNWNSTALGWANLFEHPETAAVIEAAGGVL